MKAKKTTAFFSLGACCYGFLEILWRGYTHWSMLCAGGICFCGLGAISAWMKKEGLWLKCLVGCIWITGVEYIFGLVFNLLLKRNVWNYKNQPFNLHGQICALYSFFWFLLCLVAVPLAERLNQQIK